MLYKNISKQARYICSDMTKILIQPGGLVEISMRDLQHAGNALMFFESVAKATAVKDQEMTIIPTQSLEATA